MNYAPPSWSILASECAVFLAVALAPNALAAQQEPAPTTLVGTWRLAEHWNRDSTGALIQLFGPHPIGYFTHDRVGHFSVHIMRTPPMPAVPTAPDSVALRALREQVAGYYGAFGTYAVDSARSEGVYRSEGSTQPNIIGTEVRLPYRVTGDSLIIGDGRTWRRVWVRVR